MEMKASHYPRADRIKVLSDLRTERIKCDPDCSKAVFAYEC